MHTKAHWENVYRENRPDEVSWHQNEPTLSLKMIAQSHIAVNDAILDVGGGTSVLVDHLLDRGFLSIAVLDIAGPALAQAKTRLGERAGLVEWFEADVRTFQAPHQFDVWHDRAVFHFLISPEDRKNYMTTLRRTLRPGGIAIIATFAPDGPPMCSGLDVVRYGRKRLWDELGAGFGLLQEVPETHVTPWNTEQCFNYFHFVYFSDGEP